MSKWTLIHVSKPGVHYPVRPTNAVIEAIERGRAKLCLNCGYDKCINCYESKSIDIRRYMFNKALEYRIPEDIARKMFIRGDLL